jgi:hypothetical protein
MATNSYMAHIYINNINALKSYMSKLDPNKFHDFDKIKIKIKDSLDKLMFQLKDLRTSHEFKSVFEEHRNIYNVVCNSIESFETLEQILSMKPFIDMLDTNKIDDLRVYDLTKDADNYLYSSQGYADLSLEHLNNIYKSIKNKNQLNIFMPNCFNGQVISAFAKEKDNTYGNSVYYVQQAKQRMTRVIKGTLKGSHITNNYFDVVFLIPEVTYKLKTDPFGKVPEPNEKVFVRNCVKYCRQDGLLVITLPATRIDTSFAFYLSKILSDNTIIIKEPDSSLERITIIGQKHITQKSKPELYEKLKYIDYDKLPMADITSPIFEIPTEELVLEFFRGSTLDVDDVLEAAQTNLVNSFLNNQTQPLVVKDQSPLLPFNIGQVGLVLTSGCLDGVVEEIDGVYHVIKGMTTKLTTTQTEVSEEDNKVKSTETISNQVKINVFTANGDFISLG